VGYSIDNVAIFNALTSTNQDAVLADYKYMDECMLSSTASGNILKYHTISACLEGKGSTSKTPSLCKDSTDDLCKT